MAKHNMLLGYARGSVGDVTFSRVKGQQVARARNRQPNNPRTKSQMSQRTIFVSAVEFFRRGSQNLFQFAFENKKATQSDYNAFMSENAKKGIFLKKDMVNNANVPMIGNFTMSKGTLTRDIRVTGGIAKIGNVNTQYDTSPAKIGEFSSAMKNFGYSDGDIITLVAINADDFTPSADAPVVAGNNAPKWNIKQITLDSTSTDAVTDGWNINFYQYTEGGAVVGIDMTFQDAVDTATGVGAVCAIVSRKESTGLKVTNSELVGSTKWNQAIQYGQAAAWKNAVLADWKAADEAILEGSLS